MKTHHEAACEIPVVEETDVVVCGAGPAGVAAALAAARTGAKTRLIEVHGCLGGVWTAGALSWVIDAGNKPGIMRELTDELDKRGARAAEGKNNFAYDVEMMKLVLEEMCAAAGVKIQLHTRVVAAARDTGNRLAVAITESKSGRQAWAAKAFVDATGDGDLAALAGCGFDLGREGTGETQPMSLMAMLTGLKPAEVETFTCNGPAGHANAKKALLEEMQRAGVTPSYAAPTLFHVREDLFALMANHEYGVSALDAAQITAATLRARGELHLLVDGLRTIGGVWKSVRIVVTGEQIGVREGRRIHGLYRVSEDDLARGARHKDAICRVTFGVDVHSPDPTKSKSFDHQGKKAQHYDIPLRALIAKDVEGLLLAGRCISGDFIAHSSYRVTGNAVAMGQAAGVVAALSARMEHLPRQIPWDIVAESLKMSGVQ